MPRQTCLALEGLFNNCLTPLISVIVLRSKRLQMLQYGIWDLFLPT